MIISLSPLFADDVENRNPDSGSFGFIANSSVNTNSIGLIYHFNQYIAISPSYDLYLTNEDYWKMGGSLELDVFFPTDSSFSIYIGLNVRYSYYFNSYYNYFSSSIVINDDKTQTAAVSILVGGRYMVSPNFGLFASIGIGYTHSFINSKTKFLDGTSFTSNDIDQIIGTVSARLGAVFYFIK